MSFLPPSIRPFVGWVVGGVTAGTKGREGGEEESKRKEEEEEPSILYRGPGHSEQSNGAM